MMQMITMSELLESKTFRSWLQKTPKLSPFMNSTPPWRLYVQKEQKGKWAIKEFAEYEDGVKIIFDRADDYFDMTLASKRCQFKPPVIVREGKRYAFKIPEGHVWCNYCRRPTLFRTFTVHHAFPKAYRSLIAGDAKRCSICGIRKEAMNSVHGKVVHA